MVNTAGICRENFFFAILSGIALTISFPKLGISWAAWGALTGLLFAVRDVSIRDSFILGLITGMVHFATLLYWLVRTMHVYGYLPLWLSVIIFIPLVFYLALYIAAFTGLLTACGRGFGALFLMPVFWVVLEYVRSVAFTGFPWGLIGYTQVDQLHLIQIADVFGVYGVSFAVVLGNGVFLFLLLFVTGKKWQGRNITASQAMVAVLTGIVTVALMAAYGAHRLKTVDAMVSTAEKINVAVVQGNIPQTMKWDMDFRVQTLDTYVRLSREANEMRPDVIVWPETATPFYMKYNMEFTKTLLQAIREMGTWFIVGSPTVEFTDQGEHYFNSAYLVTPTGDFADRNDKVHLVPFGEYVPFKKWLPFIHHIVAQVGEFKPGEAGDTLDWPSADIGMLICYEIIFPELAARMTANDAGLLVNITNDAWFGRSSAPYQHFSMAVFRAVENRRALIRAANTGISGFIDPAGRIMKSSGLFEEAALTCFVPIIRDSRTFYTRHGYLLVLCCFLVPGICILLKIREKRRGKG